MLCTEPGRKVPALFFCGKLLLARTFFRSFAALKRTKDGAAAFVSFPKNSYIRPMKRLLLLLCGAAGLACAHPQSAAAAAAASRQTPPPAAASAEVPDLPLPQIPATLRQPAQRAAYLIEHFWDALEFRDTLRSRNAQFVEQHFVNFLSLFPHADPASHRPAVDALLDRAAADGPAYRLIAELAEKYLFERDSPLLSEETYILFLERVTRSPHLGPYESLRPRYQLEALRKNRPGMQAADFAYTRPDGSRTTLRETAVSGRLLLIFYDPTCDHCREVMGQLRDDLRVARAVAAGEAEVLAICVGGDRAALLESSAGLPETWLLGCDEGLIYDSELYMLRSMPTLFLLDADQRVVLKNTSVEALTALLSGGE